MNPAQFRVMTLETLKNYWRIKAANALYGASTDVVIERLEYTNVPAVGFTAQDFASEVTTDALLALQTYIARRLPRDLFLALIANFEARVIARLRSLGEPEDGTLGTLQSRIQARISLAPALIEDLNEIRERRNAMIHHADVAGPKYVAAAGVVSLRAAPFVNQAVVGDNVMPVENYLAYAGDALVRYSNAIG
jgi:hypothetical protein